MFEGILSSLWERALLRVGGTGAVKRINSEREQDVITFQRVSSRDFPFFSMLWWFGSGFGGASLRRVMHQREVKKRRNQVEERGYKQERAVFTNLVRNYTFWSSPSMSRFARCCRIRCTEESLESKQEENKDTTFSEPKLSSTSSLR